MAQKITEQMLDPSINLGGGTRTFTASGAITAQDPVVLNTDGTVSAITYTTSSEGVDTAVPTAPAALWENATVACDDTGKVVRLKLGAGSDIYSDVGTITGTSIAWDATNDLVDAGAFSGSSGGGALVHLGSGTFVAFYGPANDLYCTAGTLSGTTMTWNTTGTVVSNSGSGAIQYVEAVKVNATTALCLYKNAATSDTMAVALTVSGTTVTLGTSVIVQSSQSQTDAFGLVWDETSNKGIALTTGGFATLTVSGTTVTVGTLNQPVLDQSNRVVFDSTIGKAVFVSINYIRYITVSGTDIVFEAPIDIFPLKDDDERLVIFDPSNDNIISIHPDSLAVTTANGGTDTLINTPGRSGTVNTLCRASWNSAGNNFVILSDNGAFVYDPVFSDAFQTIGTASSTVTDTDPVNVNILGSIDSGQTGLTPATEYYVTAEGNISTSGAKRLGKALSATELQILAGSD